MQLDYQYQVLSNQKNQKSSLKLFSNHGAPEKVLTDNGGEFANSKFLDMAESISWSK